MGLALFLQLTSPIATVRADEGMWLYNQPPREALRQRYGFEVTASWLEHLQQASVRISSGGSGSFVSEDGLVMSNHHVASDAIQKVSTPERNLMKTGFLARSLAEEIPCGDLEMNVLVGIEDVTERVNAAVPAGAASEQAAARRSILATIEKESLERTGLKSEVVTLFQGGAYHLYRYRRYTDIRLVFAPEEQTAFFGGDPDNFEYPRYCLDVAFFRVWENGKPVHVDHFLRWNPDGTKEGDLVFVSGHPGRTMRLLTVAEFEELRDDTFPTTVERLLRKEVSLSVWAARSRENARRARDVFFSVQNSRKARLGGLAALQDPVFFGELVAAEKAFRERLKADPKWSATLAAYDRIANTLPTAATAAARARFNLLETGWGFDGDLFPKARTLLRAAVERSKPNGDRLREFRDSNRGPLELELFSPEPIFEDFEILQLANSLSYLVLQLGASDPLVQAILAGQSPQARAAAVINGTKLKDVAVRRRLYEAGADAVRAANDPLIELARTIDDEARAQRKEVEESREIRRQAHAEIARARFALEGAAGAPDATGSLRLSYGTVKGYEADGQKYPAFTQLGGLYERSASQGNTPPFDLPPRWASRRGRVNLDTPFNFISTADIIGGNSGSPTVDREGRLVGLIFDGNLPSLALDFAFEDRQARALSVDARAIIEALRRVYDARPLAEELLGRRRPKI